MPKYHILYEAEIEPNFEISSKDVDDLFNALDGELDYPGGELIVTPIETEPELPTTPGSVVREPESRHWHPGWALNSVGEWASLLTTGYVYSTEAMTRWFRDGRVVVIFDAGKVNA